LIGGLVDSIVYSDRNLVRWRCF